MMDVEQSLNYRCLLGLVGLKIAGCHRLASKDLKLGSDREIRYLQDPITNELACDLYLKKWTPENRD
jgi:hypothetical protein